jgi:archaemetzincin
MPKMLCFATILLGCSAKEALPQASTGNGPLAAAPKVVEIAPVPSAPVKEDEKAQPLPLEILHIQLLGEDLSKEFFEDMAFVKRAIEAFYRFDVRLRRPVPLPEAAWYPPRKRYRAEKLLDYLDHVRPGEDDRIIGITTEDISTTKGRHKDWGILGLATLDGKVAVVSTYRTVKKLGRGKDRTLRARHRFAKTVVHELGHNLGLDHCPNRGCLMEDAKGTVSTTDREHTLCDACQKELKRLVPNIYIDDPVPPWPKPRVY